MHLIIKNLEIKIYVV